jgi:pimeloyl-ACP methyl ester carboxylesterase
MRRLLRGIVWTLLGLAVLLAAFWFRPAFTPAIPAAKGAPSIAEMSRIVIGGVPQWVLIRGADVRNPVLLFLHGGPGMTMSYLAHDFQRPLEKEFVVVQWDRRGAGKSYTPAVASTLTSEQLVADTVEMINYLRQRFHRDRILLVGHSWGTYLGMVVVSRHPELISAYVGIAQLAAFGERNRQEQLRWLRDQAQLRGDAQLLRRLNHPPDQLEPLVFRYGGELRRHTSFWPLVLSGCLAPEYNGADVRKLIQGLQLYSAHFRMNSPERQIDHDIPAVQVPVYFFTGRYDMTDPPSLTQAYFNQLRAPRKKFIWFEHSAHFPFWEEPARFADEMAQVLRDFQPPPP